MPQGTSSATSQAAGEMKLWSGCSFSQRRYIFVLCLRFRLILVWKESLFTVYSCALWKMGSGTMAFMAKNSDADISGKGKSQAGFCWYMSCRLECWYFGRKIKLEMVKSAQSLQWAQKNLHRMLREKDKYLWIGEGIFSYGSWHRFHICSQKGTALSIPSAKNLIP